MIDTGEAAASTAAGPKEESKSQQKTGENVEENGGCGKEEEEVNNYARYHSLWTIHNYLSNPLQVSAEFATFTDSLINPTNRSSSKPMRRRHHRSLSSPIPGKSQAKTKIRKSPKRPKISHPPPRRQNQPPRAVFQAI